MYKPMILVVEDDLHLMEGIRDILEINGYNVLTAANGVHGLEVLRAQEQLPDLIVSDIMMPRMDGYEFFREVRSQAAWVAIPFIFLTAKGERDDIRRGKSMGAEDYVVKPFDAEELLIAVGAKLERRNQLVNFWQGEVSSIKHNILTILNHEFRTPLTYVVAYADMLHRDADDLSKDDMRSFLRGINAGANRLRRLVENFILLVELETGEAERTHQWRQNLITNYSSLLRSVLTKYRDLADEHQVALELQIGDGLPSIRADQEYLCAAVECLLDNAIKFSDKPGAAITVDVSRDGDSICFAVRDQGRGIPEHELEHIFQSFYQVDRPKYEDQGAGSGLAIVNGIVRMHGGVVVVESTPGEGTEFVIRLPVARVETAS